MAPALHQITALMALPVVQSGWRCVTSTAFERARLLDAPLLHGLMWNIIEQIDELQPPLTKMNRPNRVHLDEAKSRVGKEEVLLKLPLDDAWCLHCLGAGTVAPPRSIFAMASRK